MSFADLEAKNIQLNAQNTSILAYSKNQNEIIETKKKQLKIDEKMIRDLQHNLKSKDKILSKYVQNELKLGSKNEIATQTDQNLNYIEMRSPSKSSCCQSQKRGRGRLPKNQQIYQESQAAILAKQQRVLEELKFNTQISFKNSQDFISQVDLKIEPDDLIIESSQLGFENQHLHLDTLVQENRNLSQMSLRSHSNLSGLTKKSQKSFTPFQQNKKVSQYQNQQEEDILVQKSQKSTKMVFVKNSQVSNKSRPKPFDKIIQRDRIEESDSSDLVENIETIKTHRYNPELEFYCIFNQPGTTKTHKKWVTMKEILNDQKNKFLIEEYCQDKNIKKCCVCKKVCLPEHLLECQILATEHIPGSKNLMECLVCRMSSFDPESRVIECLEHNIPDLPLTQISIIDFHNEFIGSTQLILKDIKKTFQFYLDKYSLNLNHNEAVEFRAIKLNLDKDEQEKPCISNYLNKNYFNMVCKLSLNGKNILKIVGSHAKIVKDQSKYLVATLDLTPYLKDDLQEFQIQQQLKDLHTGKYAIGFFKVQKFNHVLDIEIKSQIVQKQLDPIKIDSREYYKKLDPNFFKQEIEKMVDRLLNHNLDQSWTPVKGIQCTHIKCFKFESYLKENFQNISQKMQGCKIWVCNLCGKRAVDFVTDQFINEIIAIMKKTKKDKEYKKNVLTQIQENLEGYQPQNKPLIISDRSLKSIGHPSFEYFQMGIHNRPKPAKSCKSFKSKIPVDDRSYDSDCYDCTLKNQKTRSRLTFLYCQGEKNLTPEQIQKYRKVSEGPCRNVCHLKCAGFKRAPAEDWYCNVCKEIRKSKVKVKQAEKKVASRPPEPIIEQSDLLNLEPLEDDEEQLPDSGKTSSESLLQKRVRNPQSEGKKNYSSDEEQSESESVKKQRILEECNAKVQQCQESESEYD